jgi:hypothetical protein
VLDARDGAVGLPPHAGQDPVADGSLVTHAVGGFGTFELRAQAAQSGGLVLVSPQRFEPLVVGLERGAEGLHG